MFLDLWVLHFSPLENEDTSGADIIGFVIRMKDIDPREVVKTLPTIEIQFEKY